MFGPIAHDGTALGAEDGWHRLAGRRVRRTQARAYGDADWGAIVNAATGLVTGIVGAVTKATQGNTQTQNPGAYQTGSPFYVNPCPPGYHEVNGQCVSRDAGAPMGTIDIGFGPMSPMMLVAGGLLLVVLLKD